jgi:hypothetical protein
LGDGERDVGWWAQIGFGPRPQDQQGTGKEGRTEGRPRLREAQQSGPLGVGAQGGGHAQAESRWELDPEAVERQPVAVWLEPFPIGR